MPASIDVVVVAYNRYELTESCLRHLAAQTVAHQVILVDNGSTDGTPARVAERWPGARVMSFDNGRGFAAACNRGVEAGTGAIVVLLNNDVDCNADFLERLTAPFEADPQLGSVAALMLQPGGQTIDSLGLVADATLAGFPRLQGRDIADALSQRPRLSGPAGAAAAYRRAAWDQVGGMDAGIFAYMEDLDLALRLRSAGWSTAGAADARGIHLGSATHRHRSASQRLSARAGVLWRAVAPRRAPLQPRPSSCWAILRSRTISPPCVGAWRAGVPAEPRHAFLPPHPRRSTRRSPSVTRSRCGAVPTGAAPPEATNRSASLGMDADRRLQDPRQSREMIRA